MSEIDICVFGDSIGKGIVLHPDTNRYEMIKINLDNLHIENDVNIKNHSMFGSTISKGLTIVKRHERELKEYNSIILEFGGNDCDFAWNEIADNPEIEHIAKTPIAEFSELYKQVINEIRDNGSNPIILTLPPLDPNRYFKWISRGINGDNILKYLGEDVNMIYRWQEMYNVQVMLLAAKMDVPIIDIRSEFLKLNNYRDFICSDGIHPNNDGYELIYKTIAEQYKIQFINCVT